MNNTAMTTGGPLPCLHCGSYHWGAGLCVSRMVNTSIFPQGCVCPPTSERTCQSPTCPRRNLLAPKDPNPMTDELKALPPRPGDHQGEKL